MSVHRMCFCCDTILTVLQFIITDKAFLENAKAAAIKRKVGYGYDSDTVISEQVAKRLAKDGEDEVDAKKDDGAEEEREAEVSGEKDGNTLNA